MPRPVTTAKIEITPPRLFTLVSVFVVCAFGVLLSIPLLISILALSLIRPGIPSVLIMLVVIAGTAYCMPFGLGNAYVARLARSLKPAGDKDQERFVVQLTLYPRIRSGLQAVVDDADDIGWLSFTASELVYHGDSVRLSLPFDLIKSVERQNIGLRGLFVISRIGIAVAGLPKIESIEFAERSSWLLPTSRRNTRELYRRLVERTPTVGDHVRRL